jgi:peptidoglycan/LPS O-acetylase OafA/YrhL
MSGSSASAMRYSPALDGLRTLSVCWVLLIHLGHFPGGWVGVDVFFALSGFVITRLILAGYAREGRVAFGAFYARRARRLLPALWLALVLAGLVWPWTASVVPFAPAARASLFFYANCHRRALGTQSMGALGHTWSLSVEEQFYLFWPLILALLLARGRSLRIATVATGCLVMITAALRAILYENTSPIVSYFTIVTQVDVVLVGAGAALLQVQYQKAGRWSFWDEPLGAACAWIGLVALTCVAIAVSGEARWPYMYGGFALFGILSSSIILHVVNAPQARLSRFLGAKPFAYVGARSYGIYLYHYPIFLSLDSMRVQHSVTSSLLVTPLKVLVTWAIAWASYRFYERKFMRRVSEAPVAREVEASTAAATGKAVSVSAESP